MRDLVLLASDPDLLLATVTALAVFGAVACMVQAVWTLLRSLLGKVVPGIHPETLPWRLAGRWLLAAAAFTIVSRLLWVDYVAVFQPGPKLATILSVRSVILKLILMGVAKAALIALLVIALYPILRLGLRVSSHRVLTKIEKVWRRYVPKAAPYLLYYGLLMVVVSLVTDRDVLVHPQLEMELLTRNLQETLVAQLQEMRSLWDRLVGSSG